MHISVTSMHIFFILLGVSYMSPFWNHIWANPDQFIHVRSQISWYVCSMYLGTNGDLFSYTCTFCALFPPRCCVLCVWVLFPTYVPYNSPLSYLCTVQFSNTPNVMLKYAACVLLIICRLTTWRRPTSSLIQPHPRLPPPSNSLPCKNSHHHHV
jgi:hypothetical protein